MIGRGAGPGGRNHAGRERGRWPLGMVNHDPCSSHCQQVRDELGDPAFRRMKLHPHQTLAHRVIRTVEIPGDLGSLGKVERRLQMPDDQDRVFDALGP